MNIFKKKYEIKKIIEIIAIQQRDITNLQTELKILDKNAHKWVDKTEIRLKEIEKIIKNQPLIKKYQKTLDIFLKNAQN